MKQFFHLLYGFVYREFSIYYIVCLGILCFPIQILSQDSEDPNFNEHLQQILRTKTSNYQVIDSLFYKSKHDSIKMKTLSSASKELGYLEGESYALNMLGTVYRNVSFYDKAIRYHSQANELAKKANNLELQVISLNMLGVVYRRLDVIRSALDYHKQALDLAETIKRPSFDLRRSIAVSLNSMGNIYLVLKQYDLAIQQFDKSLIIEKELDNKLGLAINNQNIGYAKEEKGLLSEALENYETSLSYNNEIDSDLGRIICYNSIGKIYIKQAKYNEAYVIIKEAFDMALILNDQYYIATSYVNLGWVQLKLKRIQSAEANLKKALKIAEEFNLKTFEIEANNYLSELYEVKGNYKSSMMHFKRFVELDETISNERNLQYVSDLILKYESEQKTNQINALASENEIVKLNLEQNKNTMILSAGGLILFAIIMLVLYKQRQLKNEKKIIMLEQDMLRSQMNPHFIFNSLNSIKLYIINNEKENAVYYLNKFSKLIRKILVASTEKIISLEDELETMALYINIENIRFSNDITYEVTIDPLVNPSSVRVPSLVLQPFLENALWHGLSSKIENKKIELSVTKRSDNYITVSIKDNGIGRLASQNIKKKKTLKRKSVGIALTRERMANFSKGFVNDYNLDIIDLYDSNKKAIGTEVIINIPINEPKLKTA